MSSRSLPAGRSAVGRCIGGLWLSVALLGVNAVWGQPLQLEDGPEDRARVRLRTVRLRVEPGWRTRPGECLTLSPQDLKVTIRGQPVATDAVIELQRERQPTLHAIVLDTSRSMAGQLEQTRRAATEYVEQLRPEHEQAMLLTFDDSVLLVQRPTADKQRLTEAIDSLRVGAYTSLLDGLHYAIRELAAHDERPVLLLLTDGVDSASFHERYEVQELLGSRPDLTIFTIGLRIPEIRAGVPGLGTTKRFLQRLARNSHGEFFDAPTTGRLMRIFRRIREMLDNEIRLTVVDPDPIAEPGKVRVASLKRGCAVQQLPVVGEGPTSPVVRADVAATTRMRLTPAVQYQRIFREAKNPQIDAACAPAHSDGDDARERFDGLWFIEPRDDRLSGCGLDIAMEHGLLHDSRNVSRTEQNGWIEMRTRPFEIVLPPFEQLPRDPVEAMDRLARRARSADPASVETDARKRPRDEHARPYYDHPALFHGRTFFDARFEWARATYRRPEYRAWVDRRLEQLAREELSALERRFRNYAPDATDAALSQAVLESEEGRAIIARAAAPTEDDLQQQLAAWLGDYSAHDLFVSWEAQRINRLLFQPASDEAADEFVEDWSALRRLFFAPSYARLLTLLVPGYDPECACVGYWRIVLPRPGWLDLRVQGWRDHGEYGNLPLDLIPDEPMAFRVIRQLREERPELAGLLATRRYRAAPAVYELTAKPWKQGPKRAFNRTRVTLDLAPAGTESTASAAPRLSIVADLNMDKKLGELKIENVAYRAEGDAELLRVVPDPPAVDLAAR